MYKVLEECMSINIVLWDDMSVSSDSTHIKYLMRVERKMYCARNSTALLCQLFKRRVFLSDDDDDDAGCLYVSTDLCVMLNLM